MINPVRSDAAGRLLPRPLRFRDDADFVHIRSADLHTNDATVRRAVKRELERSGVVVVSGGAVRVVVDSSSDLPGEGYSLSIVPGEVGVRIGKDGIHPALSTIRQLARPAAGGGVALPVCSVSDAPRFGWRGLLIDPARHWIPPSIIERTLDAMALVKLNVLHLHLSDDQAFRLESRRWPRLHEVASCGEFYTQEETRALVEFAADRGIRIVPELDVPGHTRSLLHAYPEIGFGNRPFALETRWGIFDSLLDPTSDVTWHFLESLFGELVELFPDEYVHIGGDEVAGREWEGDDRIARFMAANGLETPRALQSWFTKRLAGVLARHGRKIVGWEDIASSELDRVAIELYTGRPVTLASEVAVIVSTGFYLDHARSASFHYQQDPEVLASGVSPSQILGGEACMWSEFVTAENVETRLWPRLAAIAERFWASPGGDVDDLYDRLDTVSERLKEIGIDPLSITTSMLARLSGGVLDSRLATLASLVEPVKEYERQTWRVYTVDTELVRLVDAVPPESKEARRFRVDVDAVVDGAELTGLRERLERWRRVAEDRSFDSWLAADPARDELRALLPPLKAVTLAGTAALDSLESPGPFLLAPELEDILANASAPVAELIIAIAEPVGVLLAAARARR